MMARFAAFVVLAWALGFGWFALLLPQPLDGRTTDAIVVLTGGAGRLDRGIALMQDGAAKRMLISGVDRSVRPHELAVRYDAPDKLFDCCITLGSEAIDTRSNGIETARWLERRGYDTVRLITSDWHMRRASFELRQALPVDIVLVYDAVPSQPSFSTLFKEYHKYLVRRIAALIGI
ncbi:MAG: YdcF family protein [Sphingobium sp.]